MGVTVTTSVAMSCIFIELAGFIVYSEESLLGPTLDNVTFRESFLDGNQYKGRPTLYFEELSSHS